MYIPIVVVVVFVSSSSSGSKMNGFGSDMLCKIYKVIAQSRHGDLSSSKRL